MRDGYTDIGEPDRWDPDEMERPIFINARTGTYPLGDFTMTRNEGESNVSFQITQGYACQIGRLKFEHVMKFEGTGIVQSESGSTSKEMITPGYECLIYVYPQILCHFKLTVDAKFLPEDREITPAEAHEPSYVMPEWLKELGANAYRGSFH